MKFTVPVVSALDKERLQPFVRPEVMPSLPVLRLRRVLEAARVLKPERIPSDVVTMNSRVRIRDMQWDDTETLTLTYPDSASNAPIPPEDHDGRGSRLTIISPLGSALLGTRVGHDATWIGTRGPRRVRVESIEFQPEQAGRYDL